MDSLKVVCDFIGLVTHEHLIDVSIADQYAMLDFVVFLVVVVLM